MMDNKDIQGHDEKERDMTEQQQREERALQVTGMLRTAETLAMESRRMGERFRHEQVEQARQHEQARHDREEHPVCASCLNTGWVYMGVETEDGEFDEVAYLCRRCTRSAASVLYGEIR